MKFSVKKTFLAITMFIIILFNIQAFSLNSSAFFVTENGMIFSNYNDRIGISGVTDESITDLIIPETVEGKIIEIVSLSDLPALTSISIPSGVSKIYIKNCPNITSYFVDLNNESYCTINGVIYDKNLKILYFYPVGNSDEEFALPDGITKIEDKAFKNCTKLKEISFPESLTEIGAEAFYGCSFKNIKLPENLISIGSLAFAFNENLEKVVIPENVTEAFGAFCKCSALNSVTFLREKPSPNNFLDYYYSGNFDGCEQKIIFYVPDTVVQNYKFLIELYDIVLNYDVQTLSQNPDNIKGDVNFDGIVSLADVLMLQKALLNSGNIKSWIAGDIDENNIVNVFDLILIKRMVIGN